MKTLIEKLEAELLTWENAALANTRISHRSFCIGIEKAIQIVKAHSDWIPVGERLPDCNMKKGSLGVAVLIWPPHEIAEGHSGYPYAYFGMRMNRKEPCFYLHGSEVHGVTHWMPIPEFKEDTK